MNASFAHIPLPSYNVRGTLSACTTSPRKGSCVSESFPDTVQMIKRSVLRSLCFTAGFVSMTSKSFRADTRMGSCVSILAIFAYHG